MGLYLRLRKLVLSAAVMVSILVAVTGCLFIPLGSEITVDEVEKIREGVTTKHDIEQMLGKPNVLENPVYSVYRLTEKKFFLWIYGDAGHVYAGETYTLAIIFDSDEVVQEFKYEASRNHYLSLDGQFPDRLFVLAKDYFKPSVDISDDGSWVTVLTDKKLLLHEIDKKTKEISNQEPASNLPSGRDSLFNACAERLMSGKGKGWDENTSWLLTGVQKEENFDSFEYDKFTNENDADINLNHKKCKPSELLDISDDATLLAVSNRKILSLWSIYEGRALNQTNTVMPIKKVSFSPDSKLLISISQQEKQPGSFSKETASVVNVWSVPSLQNVTKFERNIAAYSAAFSDDGKLFSIDFDSHIEIWERITGSNYNAAYASTWPFQLKKVIPKPFNSGWNRAMNALPPARSLRFSSDGKLLMSVDDMLFIWDTGSGKLLALLGTRLGVLDAEFYNEEYIIVAGRTRQSFWPPIGFYGARIWKLPLSSILNQKS